MFRPADGADASWGPRVPDWQGLVRVQSIGLYVLMVGFVAAFPGLALVRIDRGVAVRCGSGFSPPFD